MCKEKRKKFYLTQKDITDIQLKYNEVKELTYDVLAFEYRVSNEMIKYIVEDLKK